MEWRGYANLGERNDGREWARGSGVRGSMSRGCVRYVSWFRHVFRVVIYGVYERSPDRLTVDEPPVPRRW